MTVGGIGREGSRVRGESREINLAKVKAAIGGIHGIPGAIRTGRDLHLKPGVECSLIDEGGRCRREGMWESPEGRGSPSEVDPARGPAVGAAGTRGGKRGRVRRGPQRTTGTRRRAQRGGKGESRVFGQRPQRLKEAVGRRSQAALAVRLEGGLIQEQEFGRSWGCRTLGTRRGHGRREGRGVTGHGDGANGKDRGDKSRGGDHRGGSTANRSRGYGSVPTSRRGRLKRRIQPRADLLAERLPLELGQGRGR